MLAPWFAYWLKGKGSIPLAEALTFQTGTNEWVASDAWPPREAKARNLYFHEGGRLSFDPPQEEDAADSYVSDPAHPVPYRHRPIEATYGGKSGWSTWLVEDQRFVDGRPDVLSWQTEALAENLTISGRIRAHLFASTTGSDADWIVKLIDRYPDDYKDPTLRGYQLMIADEVLRSRFRNSFEKPEAVSPGEVVEYTIDLHTNNHAFLQGSQGDGAGAKLVVSGDRPQSAEIRAEHFPGQGGRLSAGDAARISNAAVCVEHRTAGEVSRTGLLACLLLPPE